jgi:hypothetical protein
MHPENILGYKLQVHCWETFVHQASVLNWNWMCISSQDLNNPTYYRQKNGMNMNHYKYNSKIF